jgi:hypothetical protein
MFYASGCLLAAVKERAADFETRFVAGIWSVALVSTALAFVHLECASRGVAVLFGAHDGFLQALLQSGANEQLLNSYYAARPIVISCLYGLGFAHVAAAYFLFRLQLRKFVFAWIAALLAASAAVAVQLSVVWSSDGLPSEFFALLVQAVALPQLLIWSRDRRLRRTG